MIVDDYGCLLGFCLLLMLLVECLISYVCCVCCGILYFDLWLRFVLLFDCVGCF